MTAPALSVDTSNGRYYRRPGRHDTVPSITNIIGMLDKPALRYWYAKECANYAADNREKLATLNRDEAYTLVRNAPNAYTSESPASIGNQVHAWIERFVKGEPPSHDELMGASRTARGMWQAFTKVRNEYEKRGLEFIATEFTVWSDTHGYAGTADLHLRIDGFDTLVDTKTGKGIYPETAMQLAAIANADVILTPDGSERPVPSFDRYAILHLRPGQGWHGEGTLAPVEKIDEAFASFLGLKAAFDWKVESSDQTILFSPKIS